ncbi:MAG: hypothetical protein LBC53_07275 [Spirochaetaceae bacterium]|nr:hypothetical protein [Spirochaetaceae bacterium]
MFAKKKDFCSAKTYIFLGFFFFTAILTLFPAELPAKNKRLFNLSDDSQLRKRISAAWFVESPLSVSSNKPFTATLESGENVQVRALRSADGGVTVALARELAGSYPGWAAGSWAYTRDKSGNPVRLRFFPRSDPYVFIQFRPFNHNKSQMDIVVYDAYITRSWSVPGSFNELLTKPVKEILGFVSKDHVKYLDPRISDYADVQALVRGVRKEIGKLRYEDDGAINENGEYVYIETLSPMGKDAGLNCSGFSKWVIDGILRPVTGKRLDIETLKKPSVPRGSPYTDVYEELRDPFFGLDWVRNLAREAVRTFKTGAFDHLEEYEVRKAPFSLVILREGKRSENRFYPGFLPEAGFGVEGLGALLYTLAINEPGNIYLGAVNNDVGPRPRMRQYFHIAVFAPYFDEAGVFHIALFESAAETSFNGFRARYPGHYINLVRVPIEGVFSP